MEQLVLSVSQLNNYLKSLIDEIPVFRNLYISGEISNFTNHYRSGHYYFSLKDDKAVVKAVMFRAYNEHIKFIPENGMKVLVKARLSVFERDGVYQLYVEDMQPKGLGGLNLAYEQLKEKLEQEGLFSAEHKKELPKYPSRIGVITSPDGAVLHDIQNVISRRYPIASIDLVPVQVQGESAAQQLTEAVRQLNSEKSCDIIIIGRGGGSAEDLWAFNDEKLARAIFACEIPVISAVGHETDFTICDFVSDLRAPTPSAAAELAVPDIAELHAILKIKKDVLDRLIFSRLETERNRLKGLRSRPCLNNIGFIIEENRLLVDKTEKRLTSRIKTLTESEQQRVKLFAGRLESLSPLKVLARGYALALKDGRAVRSSSEIDEGEILHIKFAEGGAKCSVIEKE